VYGPQQPAGAWAFRYTSSIKRGAETLFIEYRVQERRPPLPYIGRFRVLGRDAWNYGEHGLTSTTTRIRRSLEEALWGISSTFDSDLRSEGAATVQ
jgi:hypothetical protein